MVFSGSQWFLGSDAIEIMPKSLCIQTCELPFADQIEIILMVNFWFLY